jgi:Zn finger protein HypA/HybF involved in hydrogenase expression
MQQMNEGEWFCANCLQMIDVLSRHGRCPYCDSNAVDVAYRPEMAGKGRQSDISPEIVLSINL